MWYVCPGGYLERERAEASVLRAKSIRDFSWVSTAPTPAPRLFKIKMKMSVPFEKGRLRLTFWLKDNEIFDLDLEDYH